MDQELYSKVKYVIPGVLGIDPGKITPELRFSDFGFGGGFDHKMIDLKMELEEVFGVEISDEELEQFFEVRDVVNCIDTKDWRGVEEARRSEAGW